MADDGGLPATPEEEASLQEALERRRDRVEIYRRPDGTWDWRRIARNGQIVSTPGSQGYEESAEVHWRLRRR
jgi:uncharacterized protein YegP (UPF0339 family)